MFRGQVSLDNLKKITKMMENIVARIECRLRVLESLLIFYIPYSKKKIKRMMHKVPGREMAPTLLFLDKVLYYSYDVK